MTVAGRDRCHAHDSIDSQDLTAAPVTGGQDQEQ